MFHVKCISRNATHSILGCINMSKKEKYHQRSLTPLLPPNLYWTSFERYFSKASAKLILFPQTTKHFVVFLLVFNVC